MLYLIIDDKGQPLHKWSVDPVKDFAGFTVKGEALKMPDGNYADTAVLSVVNGEPVIDQAKVDAIALAKQTQAATETTKKTDRAARLALLNSLRGTSLTAGQIKQVIEALLIEVLDGR